MIRHFSQGATDPWTGNRVPWEAPLSHSSAVYMDSGVPKVSRSAIFWSVAMPPIHQRDLRCGCCLVELLIRQRQASRHPLVLTYQGSRKVQGSFICGATGQTPPFWLWPNEASHQGFTQGFIHGSNKDQANILSAAPTWHASTLVWSTESMEYVTVPGATSG